MLLQKCRKVFV